MGDRGRTKQLTVLLLLCCTVTVHAQRFSADTRSYFDYGDQSYVTTLQSPAADSLYVLINTAHALFSFLKTDRTLSSRGAYFAVRDLSVEVRDAATSKVVVTRSVRDTIFAKEFSETTSKQRWESKVVALPLSSITTPLAVDVRTEVRDGFLSRIADRPASQSLTLRAFSGVRSLTAADTSNIGIGDPIVFDGAVADCGECARNYGNTTEFGRDLRGVLPIALALTDHLDSVTFSLYQESDQLQTPKFERHLVRHIAVLPESFIMHRREEVLSTDSLIRYRSVATSDTALQYILVPMNIDGRMLDAGDYSLVVEIHRGSQTRRVNRTIQLEWHDMPLSLQNAKDAIPPMSYILTDEEYSAMSSGSNAEELQKLYGYWKTQDPTPSTAYNEKMAEFYRRADYAYFNFARSPRQLDGAMTDRGKVYILYGPPTSIQRSFLVGEQPTETWTYSNNVKKVFRFVGQGGDSFKLIEVKPL